MILCEGQKMKLQFFSYLWQINIAICRAANTELFLGSAAFAVTKR